MHLAAEKGKNLRLRQFLSGNVNEADAYGRTALYAAAYNGHLRCVSMLLDAKADVNALSNGSTALIVASDYNHLDVVNALIEARADLNIVGGRGQTALITACKNPNSHHVLTTLLDAGALVNVPGTVHSLMYIAAACGTVETLKLLIAAGADLDGIAGEIPPLCTFAMHGNYSSAKLLLDAKANVNAYSTLSMDEIYSTAKRLFDGKEDAVARVRADSLKLSPISIATHNGHLEMVELFISAGADLTIAPLLHELVEYCFPDGRWTRNDKLQIDAADMNPNLAADLKKISCDYPGVLKALVDAKADISAPGLDGKTPLYAAASKKNVEAVNALLAVGADPNDVGDDAESALWIAAGRGCLGAVTALIAARADVNYVNSTGHTPLLGPIFNNHILVVSALIAAGANVNFTSSNPDQYDSHCTTPLDIAIQYDRAAIADALREAGAVMWYESMVKANELFSVDSSTGNIVFHEDLIDIASDEDRENALRYGVLTVRLKIVIPLLNTGVNPSIMYGGRSLLCTAGMLGYTYIVEELLDAGADITFKDRYEGMTALQHAARRKHRDIVALLLAKVKELKNVNK